MLATPGFPARKSTSTLSAILITKNEVHRLKQCLGSVAFADEIVVVDSASTDGTQELGRALGARVIETHDWPGFGPQKQRALDASRCDWVLSIDADEWLDGDLAAAVQAVLQGRSTPAAQAFEFTRMSAFCGQWMRASGWFPDRGVRLFRRGSARFSTDQVHERLIVDGPVEKLPGLLLHDSIPTLELAISKMNHYSSGRARDLQAKGRRGGLTPAILHGLWAFIRTFVFKRGFLDGRLGFVLAVHNAETTYYRYLKLWLMDAGRHR